MRVGLFTNNYLPFRGGVTTAVETVRRGLAGRGHGAWVFAPAFPGAVADPEYVHRYPSVPAPTYPGFSLPLPISPRLGRMARRLELDLLHAQHPFLLGQTARRLARRLRRPLVFTHHTRYEKYAHYVPLNQRFVAAMAVRLSCRFAGAADLVVAPSERMAGTLGARGVRTPVVVVPTGVPVDRFRPGDRRAARRALGWPDGGPVCLYVGRLDREKSVDRVIRAFDVIGEAVSRARLMLVGQGTHEVALRGLAEAGRVPERVHFLGSRSHEDLAVVYQAADLFLFASETETQGLVLAEAHACGLAAVAVRASGVDEVVRDGETGLLTKGEPGELADAAIGLLLDPERRRAMGRAGRAVAEADFSAERQVDVLAGHYEHLIARSRPA